MDYKINLAKSNEELENAYKLSLLSFFKEKNLIKKHIIAWKKRWKNTFKNKNLILCKKNRRIIAGLKFEKKKIFRDKQSYNVFCINEIFVDKTIKDPLLYLLLINKLEQIASKKKIDIIITVARKKIDGLYYSKNYYGVGSYSKIKIYLTNQSFKFFSNNNNHFQISKSTFDKKFVKFYHDCYESSFPYITRNRDDFKKLIEKNNSNGIKLYSIKNINKKLIGYFFFKNNSILELGINNNLNSDSLIYDILNFFDLKKIFFFIHQDHRILSNIKKFDVEFYKRKYLMGGHLLKIINRKNLIKKLLNREKHLKLNIYKNQIESKFNKKIHKLCKQKIDYYETIFLLGINDGINKFNNSIFSTKNFDIFPLNEF